MTQSKRFLAVALASVALLGLGLKENEVVNAASVKVVTNHDPYAKPQQTKDWANAKKYKNYLPVQFLGINDFHGGLERTYTANIDGHSYKNAGGAARLASYLNDAQGYFKKANPKGKTFRVEAGDMVGASPANSALLNDEPTMHVLRQMNFSVGTLGNHEFDHGLAEFHHILIGAKPNMNEASKYGYTSILKDYPHQNSKIQVVIANVVNRSNGKIPFGFKPYTIKTVKQGKKSVKVGFIGILTTTMPSLTTYNNYHPYRYLDEAKTIAKYEKILRNKGVKAIVVLAHTGANSADNQTTGASVDILKKLYKIDPHNSVDLYIAAHSHQYANATVGHTKLMQAIYSGAAFDNAIGYLNPKTHDFAKNSLVGHVYPVQSASAEPTIKDDAKVAAIVKDADKRTDALANEKIGQASLAETILSGRGHSLYSEESPAGNVAVDAQLYETNKLVKEKHAKYTVNFAMTNTGGVRSDLVVGKDKSITLGAARAVQPWYNDLYVISMTGQQIYNVLNQQNYNGETRYLLISGMKLKYTETNSGANRYHVSEVIDNATGKPLDSNKRYNIVVNSFLHDGGDNFTEFRKAKLVDNQIGKDTDFLVQYIKDMSKDGNSLVAPTADRKQKQ